MLEQILRRRDESANDVGFTRSGEEELVCPVLALGTVEGTVLIKVAAEEVVVIALDLPPAMLLRVPKALRHIASAASIARTAFPVGQGRRALHVAVEHTVVEPADEGADIGVCFTLLRRRGVNVSGNGMGRPLTP